MAGLPNRPVEFSAGALNVEVPPKSDIAAGPIVVDAAKVVFVSFNSSVFIVFVKKRLGAIEGFISDDSSWLRVAISESNTVIYFAN